MKKTIGKFLMLTALAGTISSGFAMKGEDKTIENQTKYGVTNIMDFTALQFVEKDSEGKNTTVANHIVDLQSKTSIKKQLDVVENNLTDGGATDSFLTKLTQDESEQDSLADLLSGAIDKGLSSDFDSVIEASKEAIVGVEWDGADKNVTDLLDAYVEFMSLLKAKDMLKKADLQVTIPGAFKDLNAISKEVSELMIAKYDEIQTPAMVEHAKQLERYRTGYHAANQRYEDLEARNAVLEQRIAELEAAQQSNSGRSRIRNSSLAPKQISEETVVSSISKAPVTGNRFAKKPAEPAVTQQPQKVIEPIKIEVTGTTTTSQISGNRFGKKTEILPEKKIETSKETVVIGQTQSSNVQPKTNRFAKK